MAEGRAARWASQLGLLPILDGPVDRGERDWIMSGGRARVNEAPPECLTRPVS